MLKGDGSLIDEDDIAAGTFIESETPSREWFVSLDVTGRRIVLQHVGYDEHDIDPQEVMLLRAELLAAFSASREALAVLREDDDDD